MGKRGRPRLIDDEGELKNIINSSFVIDENGCHVWTRHKDASGYAKINALGRKIRIIRYLLGIDVTHNNLQACHTCDNTQCINIDHLYIGDAGTNNLDKVKRKRMKPRYGWAYYAIKK